MAPVLSAFVPAANVLKAPNTPNTHIVIEANNVTFTDTIPPQHQNSDIKDFFELVKCCPH